MAKTSVWAWLMAALAMGCSIPRERVEPERIVVHRAAALRETARPRCSAPSGLDVVPAGDAHSGSTVVMARVHGRLLAYVADEDDSAIRVLDVEGGASPRELGSVEMPGHPGRMLMLEGGRLAVVLGDRAEVDVYTPNPERNDGLDLRCTLETPDEPVDLAETPDHETLLVASDWGHALVGLDLGSGERRFSVDLPRAPRAVVASRDGTHAYIAHAVGGAMSVVDLTSLPPSVQAVDVRGRSIDPEPSFVFQRMPPPRLDACGTTCSFSSSQRRLGPQPASRLRSACQGFTLAELGGAEPRILSPMVEVATGNLTAPSSGYGLGGGFALATTELPVVAVVNEASGKVREDTVFAVEPPRGRVAKAPCLLPRAAVVSHGSLLVACMGIDSIVEYDATAQVPERNERRRWPVGSGPTGLAVHGQRAVVWSQFARTASVLSLSSAPEDRPAIVAVARRSRTSEDAEAALGRVLFHASSDDRISGDGRACASCHPNGRDDGLVWSSPGGPRQTPMLAGRLPDTAPYGWDGAGSDVSKHLDQTFKRLEGKGLSPRELTALVRYITTLPGPSVHTRGELEGLDRGLAVFLASGCGSCHSAEGAWTDGRSHDVSSRARADAASAFDTPSLRFVAGTAPYFHDGRYATLHDLLTRSDGPMGAAGKRPPEDTDALEAFVRSL
jgi:hypothetical protein